MPSPETFTILPIWKFIHRYLESEMIVINPFAGNTRIGTYTNDLNPRFDTMSNLDVYDFLKQLIEQGIVADLVLFDPPFSPRQIKECYEDIGEKMRQMDAFRTHWKPERHLINELLKVNGVVLSFGWNTVGMGKKRGYEISEILLICHGPGHNDTICMAERKTQTDLFLDQRNHA